jgi:hypothetical protein
MLHPAGFVAAKKLLVKGLAMRFSDQIGAAHWRFNCNNGHPDDACDDMIFTIRLE